MQIADRSDCITTAFESVYGAPQMYEVKASTYSSTLASIEPMVLSRVTIRMPRGREIRKSIRGHV
jgi:hypothetical protein